VNAEREKLIGARLRAFREMLQIPRTKFAFSIGCGSDQVAAYEAGRARLPYRVFRAISLRYDLYPLWLVEEFGSPQVKNSFDDAGFAGQLSKHALFSDVYDKHLSKPLKADAKTVQTDSEKHIEEFLELVELLRSIGPQKLSPRISKLVKKFSVAAGETAQAAKDELAVRQSFNSRASEILSQPITQPMLDNVSSLNDTAFVKAKIRSLSDLLVAVRKKVSERGQKSALARDLKVSRQAVDQWLSGDAKPSAELTFRLLNRVEQPERQKK